MKHSHVLTLALIAGMAAGAASAQQTTLRVFLVDKTSVLI
jgi:hypothetical protein